MTKYNWLVLYPEGLKLGKFSDIGAFVLLMAKYGITIGKNVEIGGNSCLYSESTIDDVHGPIVLKDNVKIGAGSIIFPNVVIEENSIVGAGSIVKKSIPANEIWTGSLAKKIGVLKDGKRIYH